MAKSTLTLLGADHVRSKPDTFDRAPISRSTPPSTGLRPRISAINAVRCTLAPAANPIAAAPRPRHRPGDSPRPA
jgi:hypothetical protein